MQNEKPKKYHQNVEGNFYVEDDCCVICDIPTQLAPELFSLNKEESHCYVSKQPTNDQEIEKMMSVMESAEFECIRCCSSDRKLKKILKNRGLKELID